MKENERLMSWNSCHVRHSLPEASRVQKIHESEGLMDDENPKRLHNLEIYLTSRYYEKLLIHALRTIN